MSCVLRGGMILSYRYARECCKRDVFNFGLATRVLMRKTVSLINMLGATAALDTFLTTF